MSRLAANMFGAVLLGRCVKPARAMVNDIGYKLPYSSSFFRSADAEGRALQSVEVAGAEKEVHTAEAGIVGKTVVVSSPKVRHYRRINGCRRAGSIQSYKFGLLRPKY